MNASQDYPVADPEALRSVLAGVHEKLALVVMGPGEEMETLRAIRAISQMQSQNTYTKVVVIGSATSVQKNSAVTANDLKEVVFMEDWSLALASSLCAVADLIIVPGPKSGKVLLSFRENCLHVPVIVRTGAFEAADATIGHWSAWDDDTSETQFSGLVRGCLGVGTDKGSSFNGERDSSGNAKTGRYVLQNDWGIGDELLLSAVAREVVQAYPKIKIWIRSRFGFRFPAFVQQGPAPADALPIETIYQNPTLYGPAAHSPYPGHLVQQMLDKVCLETGLKTMGIDYRPELDLAKCAKGRDRSVVLHTKPNHLLPSKDWGIERWRKLSAVLQEAGFKIRQVGDREEPLLEGVAKRLE